VRSPISSAKPATILTVAAFYKFADFPDFAEHRARLLEVCEEGGVKGTILLAAEGVNGTICGPAEGVDRVLEALRRLPRFTDLTHKRSHATEMAFRRMKVRLKKEIVTIGLPEVDAARDAGAHVSPEDWNDLIAGDDVAVIDTRNDYEVAIGSFENAIDPGTDSFRDFPDWLKRFKQTEGQKKLAMFCTGGIRCEKATAFARSIGFEEVYHLEGGILNYLEKIPADRSQWRGDCYVFDHRVSVRHGLEEGDFEQCHACGRPVAPADKASEHYIEGVSCKGCWDSYSEDQKHRFAERQRQYERAKGAKRDS
jgi:UPF0176 protein